MTEDRTEEPEVDPREVVREALALVHQAIRKARSTARVGIRRRMGTKEARVIKRSVDVALHIAEDRVEYLFEMIRPTERHLEVAHDQVEELVSVGSPGRVGETLPGLEDGVCAICGRLPCRHYPEPEEKTSGEGERQDDEDNVVHLPDDADAPDPE